MCRALITWPYTAGGRSRQGSLKAGTTVHHNNSAGSILDTSKYRDTCERSISILHGIAILRYIEYRMIRRYLGDISYDPVYRIIRYINIHRYGSIA